MAQKVPRSERLLRPRGVVLFGNTVAIVPNEMSATENYRVAHVCDRLMQSAAIHSRGNVS